MSTYCQSLAHDMLPKREGREEYVSIAGEFHDLVEGGVRVVASDGIAFRVADVVVCCDEDADRVCCGYGVSVEDGEGTDSVHGQRQ
jgi:hypothetical protein